MSPFTKDNWIQTGILLLALLGLALGAWKDSRATAADLASRISRIEQRMDDRDKDFDDLLQTVHRIEDRGK